MQAIVNKIKETSRILREIVSRIIIVIITKTSSIIDRNTTVVLTVVFNAQYDLGRHGFISAARRMPNLGQCAIGFRVLYAA